MQQLHFTVDRSYTPNEVARMICWFRYGSYPVHSTQVLHRNASGTLNKFTAAALIYRGHQSDKDDARELSDPSIIHLRMLRLAGEHLIPDLTTYCLKQIRNYVRRTPTFAWEVQAYRRKHSDVRANKDLLEINANEFAEHATKFLKDVRFESTAKNDADLAWAVVSQVAKRMER
jgi:hypothetical protein